MNRRQLLLGALAGTVLAALPGRARAFDAERPLLGLGADSGAIDFGFMMEPGGVDFQIIHFGKAVARLALDPGSKVCVRYGSDGVTYLVDDRRVWPAS